MTPDTIPDDPPPLAQQQEAEAPRPERSGEGSESALARMKELQRVNADLQVDG